MSTLARKPSSSGISACRTLTGRVALKVMRTNDPTDLKPHLEPAFRDFVLPQMAERSSRQARIGPCLTSYAKKSR